jgi:hypothetical protein
VINNIVRSPLRHFPGPLPAKLSQAWLLAITFTGRRAIIIDALHKRYGPIVRISPSELSFSSAAAVRDIYIGVNDDNDDYAEDTAEARSSSLAKGAAQHASSPPLRPYSLVCRQVQEKNERKAERC